MNMSDKEFDQLFNSKLDELEMEPSAAVWHNVAIAVQGRKSRTKAMMPFLQVAAAVVVIISVGMLFMRPQQKIALHGQYSEAKVSGSQRPILAEPDAISQQDPDAITNPQKVYIATSRAVKRQAKNIAAINGGNAQNIEQRDTSQNIAFLPAADNNYSESRLPVLTPAYASHLNMNAFAAIDQKPKADKLPGLAALPQKDLTSQKKKKKIHSLGDLLNVMIAKVDKRDDKVLEFTDNEDDDSFNVTGVNIGPIKIKKDR